MFSKVKELFRDKVDIDLYVPLSQKIEIDLLYAIREKEKIVLLYAEAGTGKTFLMKKVYKVLEEKGEEDLNIYFVSNPFQEKEFLESIFSLEETYKHNLIFIDEAQILDSEMIEKLRMLADSGNWTIVLATHEQQAKDIWTKKHFKTRINYFLYLELLDIEKIELFINSKLVQNGFSEINRLFTKRNYKLIHKLTKGNLREINQLLYRTFDIIHYFMTHYPNKVSNNKIDNKYIEMANLSIRGY